MCCYRAGVLLIPDHFAVHTNLHESTSLTSLQEYPVQVTAMNHCIRIAEPTPEFFVQINMRDFLTCRRIHQPQLIDINGHAARGLADAQIVEGMESIWTKLNAGAN